MSILAYISITIFVTTFVTLTYLKYLVSCYIRFLVIKLFICMIFKQLSLSPSPKCIKLFSSSSYQYKYSILSIFSLKFMLFNIINSIIVQIISLESIVELGRSGDRIRRNDHIRALALSVFSQCRRQLQHQANSVKALTGFGTAACTELFLKRKDVSNPVTYILTK